jgi:peptide deformylase
MKILKEQIKKDNLILTQKSKDVKIPLTSEDEENIKEMIKFIKDDEDAVGLAAPQIGISKRFFVMFAGEYILAFINPKIFKVSGKKIPMEESCLSVEEEIEVKRKESIMASAYIYNPSTGVSKKRQIFNLNGIYARIFQHELDHLNGVLISNYAKTE